MAQPVDKQMTCARAQHLPESIGDQQRVAITVAQVRGSAPREAGAQLLVFEKTQSGTIGGGSMEHETVLQAREMLAQAGAVQAGAVQAGQGPYTQLSRKRLKPSYDQCCGGEVVLLYEYIPARYASHLDSSIEQFDTDSQAYSSITLGSFKEGIPRCKILLTADEVIFDGEQHQQCPPEIIQKAKKMLFEPADIVDSCELHEHNENEFWVIRTLRPRRMNIMLFGAGHVGRALIQTLSAYDCSICWVDNRDNIFPESQPQNTRCITSKAPAAEVGDAPSNSYYLVMTHSHSLDFEICDHILARDDVAYLGLIGSKGKALRFARQFEQRGLSADDIARITCPIGIEGIESKKASAIAIAVAAQLLCLHEAGRTGTTAKEGATAKKYKMINLPQGLEVDTDGR